MNKAVKYTLIAGGGLLVLFGAVVIYNHYKKQPLENTTAQKIANTITTLSSADWSFLNNIVGAFKSTDTTSNTNDSAKEHNTNEGLV